MTAESTHDLLGRLVGRWATEATHTAMPGTLVRGAVEAEWLEGERFLIFRARTDHPMFPDSISIIGRMDRDRVGEPDDTAPLRMHYFDSRGVFRELDVGIDAEAWTIERIAPGFSQRFTGRFADGGNTLAGVWQLREDDVHWKDDLLITYRRTNV